MIPDFATAGALRFTNVNNAILEAVTDGIFGMDEQGITTFVNAGVTTLTGWEQSELIGKCPHDLVHHTRADGTHFPHKDCPIYAVSRTGLTHHQNEDLFWRKDGSCIPVSYTATPLIKCGVVVGTVVVVRDITDQKKRELYEQDRKNELESLVREKTEQLSRTNSQLNSVLEAASLIAIIAVDREGKITIFNKGAERMLGYRSDEIVGRTTPLVFHLPEELANHEKLLQERCEYAVDAIDILTNCAKHGASEAQEWTYVHKDGSHVPVCVGVTAIKDSQDGNGGFLFVAYDTANRKRAEETLKAATAAAEAANSAKSEFLATMSHEIRTPMNGIIGMADLLLNSNLDPPQLKRARTLRECAEALLAVLNDILDFSKIEASKLELEVANFDLRVLVEGVSDLMAIKAQEKGIEFTCIIEPDVPTRLCGDPSRLRQVLLNLVGNAVKFTPVGDVRVRVRRENGTEAGSLRFEVADSGIGVPLHKQHLLFERFSQADASTARQFGGTGLGLSIVRGLVRMMGGETGFHSAAGKGSTFWFTAALPVQESVQRPRALSLSGKRILVVDDNAASRAVVREFLALWQCHAEEADNPESALALMSGHGKNSFDAAIIDLYMPGRGGDWLGSMLRQDVRFAQIPIILLTPLNQSRTQSEWESQGLTCRVTKPVKQGELGACLATAFRLHPLTGAPGYTAGVTFDTISRREEHRLLVVEDNAVNQEVAAGLLDRLGYSADIVSDGPSALRALREIDYSLVLTDCQLPEMDGYELSRLVRDPATGVRNPQIPIIAVTAHSMTGDREKCLAAGMDDYLSKPIMPALLEKMLMKWLGTAVPPLNKEPEAPAAAMPITAPVTEVEFDSDDLVERLMGNENLAKKVARSFLETIPSQLVALAKAIEQSDKNSAAMVAHSIKGAAANAGGTSLARLASKLGEDSGIQSASDLLPQLKEAFYSLQPAMEKFCQSR